MTLKKIIPLSIVFFLIQLALVITFHTNINTFIVSTVGSWSKIPIERGQEAALHAAYNMYSASEDEEHIYIIGGSPVVDLFSPYIPPKNIEESLVRGYFPTQNLFDILRLASLAKPSGTAFIFLQPAQVYARDYHHQIISGWLKTGDVRITLLPSQEAHTYFYKYAPMENLRYSNYDALKNMKNLNPLAHIYNGFISFPKLELEKAYYTFMEHIKWLSTRLGPYWTSENTKKNLQKYFTQSEYYMEKEGNRSGSVHLLATAAKSFISKGISVYFVELPVGSMYQTFFSEYREFFINDMNKIAKETGAHFIPWQKGPLEDALFYDSMHLNKKGAKVMEPWLTKMLTRAYL